MFSNIIAAVCICNTIKKLLSPAALKFRLALKAQHLLYLSNCLFFHIKKIYFHFFKYHVVVLSIHLNCTKICIQIYTKTEREKDSFITFSES